jgi:hypothetical protein
VARTPCPGTDPLLHKQQRYREKTFDPPPSNCICQKPLTDADALVTRVQVRQVIAILARPALWGENVLAALPRKTLRDRAGGVVEVRGAARAVGPVLEGALATEAGGTRLAQIGLAHHGVAEIAAHASETVVLLNASAANKTPINVPQPSAAASSPFNVLPSFAHGEPWQTSKPTYVSKSVRSSPSSQLAFAALSV